MSGWTCSWGQTHVGYGRAVVDRNIHLAQEASQRTGLDNRDPVNNVVSTETLFIQNIVRMATHNQVDTALRQTSSQLNIACFAYGGSALFQAIAQVAQYDQHITIRAQGRKEIVHHLNRIDDLET